ncbi:MAG: TIGR03087 family PEP-CTERM/XrtA system glycosyltransferase [Pirellulales bacterium]
MEILFLTHRVPDPPNRGDRIRAHHLLQFLADQGNVSLGCLADEPVSESSRATLESLCRQVAIEPLGASRWLSGGLSGLRGRTITEGMFHSPKLRRTIGAWAAETSFDAVVVFCTSMLSYAGLPELARATTIVDLVDVDSQKWLDYAAAHRGPKRWIYQTEGRRLRKLECTLPSRADHILLVSQQEADLYLSFCPNDRTLALPNGVDLEYFKPSGGPPAGGGKVVFLGVLDYGANVNGLEWFCRKVWPEVRRGEPSLTFQIVGRRPNAAVKQLGELDGVELVGEVADVRQYLQAAEMVIAPLQIARGIQNKVLEALAAGKPVVATPQALEGLPLVDDQTAITAATPQQWQDALLALHDDVPRRERLGRQGRSYVEQHHHWQACLAPLSTLLPGNAAARDHSPTDSQVGS